VLIIKKNLSPFFVSGKSFLTQLGCGQLFSWGIFSLKKTCTIAGKKSGTSTSLS
jgi:hypothetical protein